MNYFLLGLFIFVTFYEETDALNNGVAIGGANSASGGVTSAPTPKTYNCDQTNPVEDCFDYFELSLVWQKADLWDKQHKMSRKAFEGTKVDKVSNKWVINGFRAKRFSPYVGNMDDCERKNIEFEEGTFVGEVFNGNFIGGNDQLYARMRENWVSLKHYADICLWEDEWSKHGTCTAFSNNLDSVEKYFATAVTLFDNLEVAKTLEDGNYFAGSKGTLETVIALLDAKAGGKLISFRTVENVLGKATYLTEIRICYDLTFDFMDCPDRQEMIADSKKYTKKLATVIELLDY